MNKNKVNVLLLIIFFMIEIKAIIRASKAINKKRWRYNHDQKYMCKLRANHGLNQRVRLQIHTVITNIKR